LSAEAKPIEAVRLLAAWGLETLAAERLELLVEPENPPSQRVAEQAGRQRDPGRAPRRSHRGKLG